MFALAFFAALRVGEMTITAGKSSTNLLLLKLEQANIIVYKDKPVCAVTLLFDYLNARGRNAGPLFCWPNNTATTRSHFAQCLSQALNFSGLDTKLYKSHSFRIGAASWAAAKGMSDAQIRTFGRWKSTAFLRYIWTPTLANSFPFNLWHLTGRSPYLSDAWILASRTDDDNLINITQMLTQGLSMYLSN